MKKLVAAAIAAISLSLPAQGIPSAYDLIGLEKVVRLQMLNGGEEDCLAGVGCISVDPYIETYPTGLPSALGSTSVTEFEHGTCKWADESCVRKTMSSAVVIYTFSALPYYYRRSATPIPGPELTRSMSSPVQFFHVMQACLPQSDFLFIYSDEEGTNLLAVLEFGYETLQGDCP